MQAVRAIGLLFTVLSLVIVVTKGDGYVMGLAALAFGLSLTLVGHASLGGRIPGLDGHWQIILGSPLLGIASLGVCISGLRGHDGLHPEWARILVGGLGALFFIGGGLLLLAIRWRGGSHPTTDPGRLSP